MKIKFHHVSIAVKDINEAGNFFGDLLGEKFTPLPDSEEAGAKAMTAPGLGIELSSPIKPEGSLARLLEQKGEGMCALDLEVDDIDEAIEHMKSRGVRLLWREEFPEVIYAAFHPKDLHGVMIVLVKDKTRN